MLSRADTASRASQHTRDEHEGDHSDPDNGTRDDFDSGHNRCRVPPDYPSRLAPPAILLVTTAKVPQASDQTKAPGQQIQMHVYNYSKFDRTCLHWTDRCRICTRAGCSNIGIACQPAEVKCLQHEEVKDTPADHAQ